MGVFEVAQGIEDPNRYLLIVEWESVEAHQRFQPVPISPGSSGV